MEYTVLLDGKSAGTVSVILQGLYYRIKCRCQIPDQRMYRLEMKSGEKCSDLGTLVPCGSSFGVDMRIAANKAGSGEMQFYLHPKCTANSAYQFCPVFPEEPFAYISRLKDAFLEIQNGQIGIMIRKEQLR